MFETEEQLDTMLEMHLRKLVEARLAEDTSARTDAAYGAVPITQ